MSAAPARPRPRNPPAPKPVHGAAFALNGAALPSPAMDRLLWRTALGLVAAVALALLFMVLGPHRVGDSLAETDFYGQYAEGARLLQHGQLDPARYTVVGPVYEIALALAGLVARDLFLAAGLLSLLAAGVTLLLWAALLRARVDARLALATVAFLATNATFFRYGYAVTTDALALALESAALFVLLARPGSRAPLWAGLLAALAFLTRYNNGVLLVAGLVAAAAGATASPERRTRAALLFAAGFLAPALAWVAYSLSRGVAVSFQLHHNIAYEVFAHARGLTWDQYQRTLQPGFHGLADVIARDPGAVAARLAFNALDHLRHDASSLLGWPVTACALPGLAFALADERTRRLWPLALAWALLFLALVPVNASDRYALALLPAYAVAAGVLFASPRCALVAGHARRAWLKPALALVPLALALVASVTAQRRAIADAPIEVIECASVLRASARSQSGVIARKPHLAWYAHVRAIPFPFVGTLPELAAYARQRHARWLYFSPWEGGLRPAFWYLLDTTAAVPGLTVRHATDHHAAVLYEIGPEFGAMPAWQSVPARVGLSNARGYVRAVPDDVTALTRLGEAASALGLFGEARDALERASRLRPQDAALALALGRASLQAGDAEGALAAFEHAMRLAPGDLDARIGAGFALAMANRPQEAAQLWRPALAQVSDPRALDGMIEVYRALGDADGEAAARAARARVER
jgi:tetratricopeptide (TPR) repeat protein